MDNSFSSPGAPPPLTSPPVITPPPLRPRKSRGWMIFAIILLVLLCLSLFGNLSQFVSRALSFKGAINRSLGTTSARQAGPRLDEVLLQDNGARNKIAVVTVNCIITSHTSDSAGNDMVDIIKAQLDRANDDSRVRAVILKVDSPGGEVMASDQINKLIADFEADKPAKDGQPAKRGKPVICSMGSLAASGGYYISAPCRWIVADDLTLTGSIGVIMESVNYRALMDKVGIEPYVFKSGKFKDMLSGMRETNEIPSEEHAMVQALVDETYHKFKDVVRDGRGQAHDKNQLQGHPHAADWEKYADGRVLSGTQALTLGFVDELGTFEDAVERAEKIAHIDNANVVEYRERYDISDFLSMFGQSSSAKNIKLDIGLDIPKLQAGYLYFLSPTFVN